jgi:hypothetical protein
VTGIRSGMVMKAITGAKVTLRKTRRMVVIAAAFHKRRKKQSRHVMVLSMPGAAYLTTYGVVMTTGGGIFASMPFLSEIHLIGFGIVTVVSYAAGLFIFPLPEWVNQAFEPLTEEELETLSPLALRAYADSARLYGYGLGPAWNVLGTSRHEKRSLAARTGVSLSGMSLADVRTWDSVDFQREYLVRRWLRYELDPALRIDHPAMTDPSQAHTARMIRAMDTAAKARTAGDVQKYAHAVRQFSEAFAAAETNSRASAEGT